MQFHFPDFVDIASLSVPSHEERLMFECFAKEKNERGANIFKKIVKAKPDRLEYLVFGLLKDRPIIAHKVANRHIAQLAPAPISTSHPVPLSRQNEKVEAKQSLQYDGLDAISKEDIQLLKNISPMAYTLPPKLPTLGETKAAP